MSAVKMEYGIKQELPDVMEFTEEPSMVQDIKQEPWHVSTSSEYI